MHTALKLGSVEYSGYLDFVSGVCPSTRLRVAPGFGVRAGTRCFDLNFLASALPQV
jgi:hypothetical protein